MKKTYSTSYRSSFNLFRSVTLFEDYFSKVNKLPHAGLLRRALWRLRLSSADYFRNIFLFKRIVNHITLNFNSVNETLFSVTKLLKLRNQINPIAS